MPIYELLGTILLNQRLLAGMQWLTGFTINRAFKRHG